MTIRITGNIEEIKKDNTIFVCYGSANHILDSYAPRLGSKLERLGFKVYGTMENPINGYNCIEESVRISCEHKDKRIIAVDSSVGENESDIGLIKFRKGKGIIPAGHRAFSIELGHDSIVGITTNDFSKIVKNNDDDVEFINSIVDATLKNILKFSKNSEK